MSKRTLDLAQTAGLLANVAVFGGLVFLGLEVRQSAVQIRAGASFAVTDEINELNAAEYSDPGLTDVLLRGEQDFESLTPQEARRFRSFQLARLNLAEHILILESEGVTDVQFDYVRFLVRQYHTKPGLKQFLDTIEPTWGGDPSLIRRLRPAVPPTAPAAVP